jgi:DNA-directed RNA polymerase subunit H
MNDNFAFVDSIYRSRMTLLDILEKRNYDVAMYRKFSPAEAAAAATALPGLSFTVYKKAEAQQDDEKHECQVRYINNMTRPKLETFFDDIPEERTEYTEVIVMQQAPIADAHHAIALKQYMKMKEEPSASGEKQRRKLRVSFFSIYMLVMNPLNHVLVPKHEIVPEDQHKELMTSLLITSKSKFPEIKFHIDPIARCIGAIPGDIVKITRPSSTSGESIIYRVCAP